MDETTGVRAEHEGFVVLEIGIPRSRRIRSVRSMPAAVLGTLACAAGVCASPDFRTWLTDPRWFFGTVAASAAAAVLGDRLKRFVRWLGPAMGHPSCEGVTTAQEMPTTPGSIPRRPTSCSTTEFCFAGLSTFASTTT